MVAKIAKTTEDHCVNILRASPARDYTDLPDELTKEIFGYLNYWELKTCLQVCRRWNLIAKDELIEEKLVFMRIVNNALGSPQSWSEKLNVTIPNPPPIPLDILKAWRNPSVRENHNLLLVPSQMSKGDHSAFFNLDGILALCYENLKGCSWSHDPGFMPEPSEFIAKYQELPAHLRTFTDRPQWILAKKSLTPIYDKEELKRTDNFYAAACETVEQFQGFQLPKLSEVFSVILLSARDEKARELLDGKFIFCKENLKGYNLTVTSKLDILDDEDEVPCAFISIVPNNGSVEEPHGKLSSYVVMGVYRGQLPPGF